MENLRKQKDAAAVSPSPAGRNTQAIAANFTAQLSTCIQGSWLNKQRPRCAPRARRVTRDPCEINPKRTKHLWASALHVYVKSPSITIRALKRIHLCTCLLICPRLNYAPTQSAYWPKVVYGNYESRFTFFGGGGDFFLPSLPLSLFHKPHRQTVVVRPLSIALVRADMASAPERGKKNQCHRD